jgi:PAS domain S-box-containing protein
VSGAILVVDDQPESLVALRTVLEPLGREVVTAPSGEEALKLLLQDDYAVIVMDVRMPGLDGFQTVELIKRRERHQDTAIIFLTAGEADSEQVTRGYSAGAVDYMLKPVDPDMLRSKVAMLLELQQKSAELRASEERFRAAFEGAPIGMGLSTVSGRWLEVNDALCELLGRSQTQLLRQPLWDLVHPSDREHERDAVRRLLRDRPLFDQSEKRFTRPDGEVVNAIVSVSLTADSHDRPQGYIWQVVDVTEQRRAEAERAARTEAEAVVQTIGKLQQVTEAALAHLDLDELLEVLVERVSEVFGADVVRILLRDQADDELFTVGAAAGLDVKRGTAVELGSVLEEVVTRGTPVTLRELPPGTAPDPDIEAADVSSLMAAPLLVRGRVAGVVEVGARGPRRFTLEDESLLILMADRAGLAIEHARAYERELSNVEMLQRSLLPDRLPKLRDIQLAAIYQPGGAISTPGGADEVGGEWYDAIPLDGGRVGVAMGDVVGHGIAAAALMGQLRHAMRAYALEGHPPAGVLDRLDRVVRSLDGGHMATVLYLVMEEDHGTVTFATAGHVPPLVISPEGEARYLETAPNPPLGVFESPQHREKTAKLEPGSTIVLYTDGLVEERGVSIDQGLEALRLAASQDPCHPNELCERLVTAMLAIHPAHDDIAVLALRALPTPPQPLHIELPSDATKLGEMRRDLGSWLREAGAAGEVVELIQMACHEACSNSIEHGYSFGDGVLWIDAELRDGRVVLTVRDTGHWVERGAEGPPRFRGHGLPLMQALMDSVELTHENGNGTSVRMSRSLAPDRVPAEA